MTVGFGASRTTRAGCVSFDVYGGDDVIGTAARAFRLIVTDEWAIDEYMLQDKFDFRVATVVDAQAAIRTLITNRYELWDSYGDPADFPGQS